MDVPTTSKESCSAGVRKRCLDFNYKLLAYCELWPIEDQNLPYKSWRYFRTLLPPLQIVRTIYALIYSSIGLSLSWHEPDHRSDRFATIVGSAVVIGKLWNLIYYKKAIAGMIDFMEKMNRKSYYVDEKCEDDREKAESWCRNITKFVTYAIVIISAVIHVGGCQMLYKLNMAPIHILFPEKTYWFYIVQFITLPILSLAIFDLISITVLDVTALSIVIQLITQFQILGYKVENIRTLVKRTDTLQTRERSPEVVGDPSVVPNEINPNLLINVLEEESLKVESLDEDNASQGCRPSSCEEEKDMARSENVGEASVDLEIDIEKYLRKCVKHHEALLKVCAEFQKVFNLSLTSQIAMTAALSIFALNISIVSSKLGGVDVNIMVAAFYIIGGTAELLILSIACSKLTEKSASIRDAAYACDWLEASEGFKRSLRIIMCRTSKPVVIKAIGIPLNLRTFKLMMRAVYYTHTMSMNIINGNKINEV